MTLMTLRTILVLCLAPSVLASCVAPANNCAGWEAIQTDQAATLDWLGAHDPAFLRQVVTHDEFGVRQGCWK